MFSDHGNIIFTQLWRRPIFIDFTLSLSGVRPYELGKQGAILLAFKVSFTVQIIILRVLFYFSTFSEKLSHSKNMAICQPPLPSSKMSFPLSLLTRNPFSLCEVILNWRSNSPALLISTRNGIYKSGVSALLYHLSISDITYQLWKIQSLIWSYDSYQHRLLGSHLQLN